MEGAKSRRPRPGNHRGAKGALGLVAFFLVTGTCKGTEEGEVIGGDTPGKEQVAPGTARDMSRAVFPTGKGATVREGSKTLTRRISLLSQCLAFSLHLPSPPWLGGRAEASDGPEGHLLRGSPSGCHRGRLIAGGVGGRGLGGTGSST